MARISKSGNLSGAVNNLVFVNSGDYQYVRTKPSKVKQSPNTKEASSAFGKISSIDKEFRMHLLQQIPLITDGRYAARHRARMGKALSAAVRNSHANTISSIGIPEALAGFSFNAGSPWEKCTNFYPTFEITENREFGCTIPELELGSEIIVVKNVQSVHLRLDAFSINPLEKQMELNLLSTHNTEIIRNQTHPAQSWNFNFTDKNCWLLVTATLIFHEISANAPATRGSSCYLWAKEI